MCPLAEVLHVSGHTVTGSDRARSAATAHLEALGITIQYDHVPDLVKSTDLVVYSSAIRENNPERIYAQQNGISCERRAEVLGDLMRARFTICISGTHGKTTTTSMAGDVFCGAGLNPTVLVGGMIRSAGSHAIIGNGSVLIAEADEYDRSFLAMYPSVAVITNIEADHLDCYESIDQIKDAFIRFTERVPFDGAVVACIDDPGVRSILSLINRTVITYGSSESADYKAEMIFYQSGKPSFIVTKRGFELGRVTLNIPGLHNVLNALAVIAVGTEMGISFHTIAATLNRFQGVRRRFEVVGEVGGITVVDDYAHHPGEIRATLDAARKSGYKRVVAVFQPHLYSRTRDFMDEFVVSLGSADMVFVTDIYKAREEPLPGISAETIVSKLREKSHGAAQYIPSRFDLPGILNNQVEDGDVVVFMGAGDIWEQAIELTEKLSDG